MPDARQQQQPSPMHHSLQASLHHPNGKFPSRIPASESISPYSTHKSTSISNIGHTIPTSQHHPVVIPNVPNLSHLNASGYGKSAQHSGNYSSHVEKRKSDSKDQRNRTSEGNKVARNDYVGTPNKQQIRFVMNLKYI